MKNKLKLLSNIDFIKTKSRNCSTLTYMNEIFQNISEVSVKMSFYAVARGKKPGIYNTWPECQNQIIGFKGARYKKFNTEPEAKSFIAANGTANSTFSKPLLNGSSLNSVSSANTSNSLNSISSSLKLVSNGVQSISSSINSSIPPVIDLSAIPQVSSSSIDITNSAPGSFNDSSKRNKSSKNSEKYKISKKLPPELVDMRNEMKSLQKQLSELRTKFDTYISLHFNTEENSANSITANLTNKVNSDIISNNTKRIILLDNESTTKRPRTEANLDNKGFCVDDDGFLQIYTDGSCLFNGRRGAQAGLGVFFGENHPSNISEPVAGRPTNNTAEIGAAKRAVEVARQHGYDKVQIHTDSKFMMDSTQKWMNKWESNGWKTSDGRDVINKQDFLDLKNSSRGMDVKFEYVPAHSGRYGNEAADSLAKEGAKRYNS